MSRDRGRGMERGASVRDPLKLSIYANAITKTDTCMLTKESSDK